MLVADDAGLAVGALDEGGVHHRHVVGDGPHDGVADEVGEADLAAALAAQVAVDDPAVDLEQLGRDLAEAGGRGHVEAPLHVGDDQAPAPRMRLALGARPPVRPGRRRPRRGGGARCGRGAAAAAGAAVPARPRAGGAAGVRVRVQRRAVVGEELLPALAHRRRVGPVLLVHLVDEPGVRPELLHLLLGHERRCYRRPLDHSRADSSAVRRPWVPWRPLCAPDSAASPSLLAGRCSPSPSPPAAAAAGAALGTVPVQPELHGDRRGHQVRPDGLHRPGRRPRGRLRVQGPAGPLDGVPGRHGQQGARTSGWRRRRARRSAAPSTCRPAPTR